MRNVNSQHSAMRSLRHLVERGTFFRDLKEQRLLRLQVRVRFTPFLNAVSGWCTHLMSLENDHVSKRSVLPERALQLLRRNIDDELGLDLPPAASRHPPSCDTETIFYMKGGEAIVIECFGGSRENSERPAKSRAHVETFKDLLQSLGRPEWMRPTMPPQVHATRVFQERLEMSSRDVSQKARSRHFAYLGGIEEIYVPISDFLCEHLDPYLLPAEKQEHYALHSDLDKEHAADLFEISRELGVRPDEREVARDQGHRALLELFEGLTESRP